MNAAEYAAEIRAAHDEYRDQVAKAALMLDERLATAREAFTADAAGIRKAVEIDERSR